MLHASADADSICWADTSGSLSTLRMCSITGIGHETKLCMCREAGTIV